MKMTVVSFADEAGSYRRAMKRLENSLIDNGFDGEFKGYTSHEEIGSPPHKGPLSVPYAFKAMAINKAVSEIGDGLYLWCDSPLYATKSIDPLFNHIKERGYLFFDNIGYSVGDYTSDACLEKFRIDRDRSFEMPMLMSCCYGFSTKSSEAIHVMGDYINAASDGVSYHGDWINDKWQVSNDIRCKGHRHDQSVQSILVNKLGLEITNAQQTFFAYEEHKSVMSIADSVCIWSGGME